MKRITVGLMLTLLMLCLVSSVIFAESLFPSADSLFGQSMPSLSSVLGRDADEITVTVEGTIEVYHKLTEDDYSLFGSYLGNMQCVIENAEVNNAVLSATITRGESSVYFSFDYTTGDCTMLYPAGTRIEIKPNAKTTGNNVLPDYQELFEKLMPNVVVSGSVQSSGEKKLENGGYEIIYKSFSEDDYLEYSNYLNERNCTVIDYHKDDMGRLYITLEYEGTPFEFIYDHDNRQATVRYVMGSRPEPTPKPTPTPTVKTKATSTQNPSTPKGNTESDCYHTAKDYLISQNWRNPDSLTIHGYTSTFSGNSYTFMIDYSAQNGFGGYNRNTAIIVVDKETNKVTMSYIPSK